MRPSVEEARGPDSVRRASGWRDGLVVEARRYEEMRVRAAEGGMRRVVCLRRGGWAVDIGGFVRLGICDEGGFNGGVVSEE